MSYLMAGQRVGTSKRKATDAQPLAQHNGQHHAPAAQPPQADPKDIPKYVTSDLWSEDVEVVQGAMLKLGMLIDDKTNGAENVKKICSLAGHMMIVAALKKHQSIAAIAIYVLSRITDIDPSLMEALVSAGSIEAILKGIETNMENSETLACGFDMLNKLIGDSLDNAMILKNAKVLNNRKYPCGLYVIAECMKAFPVGAGGRNPAELNQVHWYAVPLLYRILQHQELQHNVLTSGCGVEIMKCLQQVSTEEYSGKNALEWYSLETLKLIASRNSQLVDDSSEPVVDDSEQPVNGLMGASPIVAKKGKRS